jgi:UDP-N-acetylmuramate--alanine ligase
MDKSKKRIHFLGINGSGIAGVACLAKESGYDVSGCDMNKVGNYTTQLNEVNIDVLEGHSVDHLENIDKLVVSAAIYFKDRYKNIPEVVEAMNRNIEIVKWQTFLNDDLAKDKELISICGTHGKTTTTTFLVDILEDLNTDPMAMVGGINKRTNRGYRSGKGKYDC